jgi:hypothetical protein
VYNIDTYMQFSGLRCTHLREIGLKQKFLLFTLLINIYNIILVIIIIITNTVTVKCIELCVFHIKKLMEIKF